MSFCARRRCQRPHGPGTGTSCSSSACGSTNAGKKAGRQAEAARRPGGDTRLARRASELEAARRSCCLGQLTRALRDSLGDIDCALQQDGQAVSSEAERLVDEICAAAETIGSRTASASQTRVRGPAPQPSDLHSLSARVRDTIGESALCLSGGGMLGVYHMGVVRCLFELGVLPSHICGTSVGAIFGAFVATHTDEELRAELEIPRKLFRTMGPEDGPFPLSYWRCAWNFIRRGFMYDYQYQRDRQCKVVSRGLTFAEAYARTGRTLTITCVPAEGGSVVLLNRHTAPSVLISSAICASCSMPFLIEAIQLLERTPEGTMRPWSAVPETARFRDGTLGQDVPREQLCDQLNVRWTTVSQVNPHVVPLDWPRRCARRATDSGQGWLRLASRAALAAEAWIRAAMWLLLCLLQAATGLPRPGGWIYAICFQDYACGSVNVVHTEMRFVDYYRSLMNERTMAEFLGKFAAAQCETECHLPRLLLRARVEQALKRVPSEAAAVADSELEWGKQTRKQRRHRASPLERQRDTCMPLKGNPMDMYEDFLPTGMVAA